MKYIKTQRFFVKKKKKYRMKDGGKEEEGRMEPSTELRGTWRTASDRLVNTCYRIQERSLYFKCFSAHIHIHKPTESWLRLSRQWSQDTWTIKHNSPFLEENLTASWTSATLFGNVSKRCPWPSQPIEGEVTELRGPWGGGCLPSSTMWQPEG